MKHPLGTKVRLVQADKHWVVGWEPWLNVDCTIIGYGYGFDYRITNPQGKSALVNNYEVEVIEEKEK